MHWFFFFFFSGRRLLCLSFIFSFSVIFPLLRLTNSWRVPEFKERLQRVTHGKGAAPKSNASRCGNNNGVHSQASHLPLLLLLLYKRRESALMFSCNTVKCCTRVQFGANAGSLRVYVGPILRRSKNGLRCQPRGIKPGCESKVWSVFFFFFIKPRSQINAPVDSTIYHLQSLE